MTEKVEVKKTQNYNGVYAKRIIFKGEEVLSINGKIISYATKYSIQLDINKHIEPGFVDPDLDDFAWCFLNHSCNANCFIDVKSVKLIAKQTIFEGDEICFNYNTTEYKMSTPFTCNCKAKNCKGEINGLFYLSVQAQEELRNELAPHLLPLISNKKKSIVI